MHLLRGFENNMIAVLSGHFPMLMCMRGLPWPLVPLAPALMSAHDMNE